MFSLNFSFTIFSLTIFPLFWKPFTDILDVYELPKVHNKVSNYRKKTLALLSNYHLTGQFCAPAAPAISHINYWDQVNSWINLWKFWNGPLCRNKSGPSPLVNVAVYWQSSDTETCVKKLSQILANNIDNGGRGIGLRIYVRYCGFSTKLLSNLLKMCPRGTKDFLSTKF